MLSLSLAKWEVEKSLGHLAYPLRANAGVSHTIILFSFMCIKQSGFYYFWESIVWYISSLGIFPILILYFYYILAVNQRRHLGCVKKTEQWQSNMPVGAATQDLPRVGSNIKCFSSSFKDIPTAASGAKCEDFSLIWEHQDESEARIIWPWRLHQEVASFISLFSWQYDIVVCFTWYAGFLCHV